MSYQTYRTAAKIAAEDYPFYALVQAAMRQADTDNQERLKNAFPDVWEDLQTRYNAPGGYLAGDPELEEIEAAKKLRPINHGI